MKPNRLAELVVQQHLMYLVREIECGIVWQRTAAYDEELVLRRIKNLPCSFPVTADQLRAMLPHLRSGEIAVFEYSYVGNPKEYDYHPTNNSKDQLGPQYEYA
jgi:hypothetical protein